jgi:hypothetical protein
MRRALGVLVNELAEIAFNDVGPEMGPHEAQELLQKAGLIATRTATEADAAECPFGVTVPGDPWNYLTDFAVACRKQAQAQAQPA